MGYDAFNNLKLLREMYELAIDPFHFSAVPFKTFKIMILAANKFSKPFMFEDETELLKKYKRHELKFQRIGGLINKKQFYFKSEMDVQLF